MATLNVARYADQQELSQANVSAPAIAETRFIEFHLDLAEDVTMGTATDVINLAKLPRGTQVVSATIRQVEVGTGTGTLVARIGTTTVTGALTATDAADSYVQPVAAALPLVVAADDVMVNLLGAVAARTTGKITVSVTVMEARKPTYPRLASRDKSNNTW